MKLYRSYMFRSKDPVIDELRTKLQDKLGRDFVHSDLTHIENEGGPTASCMASWFWGDTKRPQNATVEAAGRAAGFRRVWVEHTLEDDDSTPKKKRVKAAD